MLPTTDIKHPMGDKQEMLSRASRKCNSTTIWQLAACIFGFLIATISSTRYDLGPQCGVSVDDPREDKIENKASKTDTLWYGVKFQVTITAYKLCLVHCIYLEGRTITVGRLQICKQHMHIVHITQNLHSKDWEKNRVYFVDLNGNENQNMNNQRTTSPSKISLDVS